MRLTKEKLCSLWRTRKQIFTNDKNSYIIDRFDAIKRLFNDIKDCVVKYDNDGNVESINGNIIQFKDRTKPSLEYFSCKYDEKTASGAFEGVKIHRNSFPEVFGDFITKIGCLLGGFDFNDYKMTPEFRIISNTATGYNDNATLISEGQVRHPSSHLADNNYFFNVIRTIKAIQENSFNPASSMLVLRWPNSCYYSNDDEAEKQQKETLKYRFPYKYFYMWTHDTLHPISLMAYRNLVQQDDEMIKYPLDWEMNQSWQDFISDIGWQRYSQAIRDMISKEEQGENFWDEMSKLISIVMIQDQETKDIKELLDCGNHAIILYGPPGTGKTYSAEELVCNELNVPHDKIDDYKFTKGAEIKNEGAWTLVQFHPNYTYEDFIGGISPQLTGDTLSYTLKEGIFKQLCDAAVKKENINKKFVIVIDEINRADLSSVFGELMYALEYRGRSLSIPNFTEPFIIPSNVYLIGTMNCIDKSLVTFDLALRRRFAFCKIMPQLSVLESMLAEYNVEENNLVSFIQRCKDLNSRIAKPTSRLQLGVDYQIGHAYYGKIKDFLQKPKSKDSVEKEITTESNNQMPESQYITTFEMEKLWTYHLYPLLEEYLGNRIDDDEVKNCLNDIKDLFTKPF